MIGSVTLVGAGPTDVGLLTLKAKAAIESAEVLVYDALVGDAILALAPSTATCINVGKRASNHIKTQSETNQILLERALAGKKVVRLKGGDPFLFGRGGEELELLAQHNVPFQVIPGITSAISVPAYNGIPVTHRDFCSSLHIITAHMRAGKELDLDYDALVRLKGTLVFLMGVTAMPYLCAGLEKAGMSPDMPAAVLHRGTSSLQKRVVATIGTLTQAAKDMEAPSIIVVGKVCALSEQFAWAEKLPLFGKKFLVTRPKERQSVLCAKLRDLGAEVVELPTIEIVDPVDITPVHTAMKSLSTYQWMVLTSPSGVTRFFAEMKSLKLDVRQLFGVKIAALGKGTGLELEKYGILADLIPPTYDAETLGDALGVLLNMGDRVFLPRAKQGNPILTEKLVKAGAIVDDLPLYDIAHTAHPILEPATLLQDNTYAIFTSASTVRGFVDSAKMDDYSPVKALCIGNQTAEEAQKHNMQITTAKSATIDSLVDLALHA
ncbi:MAG: uroporphyrinogen-III C-methyltransferase [Eubacteriales bacterium]